MCMSLQISTGAAQQYDVWGVYTINSNDARTLAGRMSYAGNPYNDYPAHKIGEFPHWHVFGKYYKGENIHFWHGKVRKR